MLVWPSGKVAAMVDYVAPRGKKTGGFSLTASHHSTGAFALNFDATGTGTYSVVTRRWMYTCFSFDRGLCVELCRSGESSTTIRQRVAVGI